MTIDKSLRANPQDLTHIVGVSSLGFVDEPFIRLTISANEVRYRLSWLYTLRASRDDKGRLGLKFVQGDTVIIIGVRNGCVYLTPLTGAKNIDVIWNLCRHVYDIMQRPIVIRKAEFSLSAGLPFVPGELSAASLEDDQQPETTLDFYKLFTTDGDLVRQATRWRRALTAFEPLMTDYIISNSLREVSKTQLDDFFASPLLAYKHTSYEEILRYLRQAEDSRYGCTIFIHGGSIRGLYVYEFLGLGHAGLYCGLTTRDRQG